MNGRNIEKFVTEGVGRVITNTNSCDTILLRETVNRNTDTLRTG